MKKLFLLIMLTSLVPGLPSAKEVTYFQNPVIRGEMADPSIIRIKNTYYATGTSSEWAPFFPVYTSKDLVNWNLRGHIFDKKPEWTSNSFWAPELYVLDGKVLCYYTARRKSDNVSYIGVASAKSPLDEFTDHGPIVEYGTEAIDAFIYDDNGELYISWKAYGLDKRPIELLASRLSADGLHLEGEPFSLLVDDENIGMEGQYHFKKGDYYYIVYSAHNCCGPGSSYDVYVARSKSFKGPYEKYPGNPILHGGTGDYISCRHGTAVETPDGRMFYMCHAYLWDDGFYCGRQPILQEMVVNDEAWVEFPTGTLAVARQAMPFAGTTQQPVKDFHDRFTGKRLGLEWSWNYPYSDIQAKTGKGGLSLSGTAKPTNHNGTALCIRPVTPEYYYETKVIGTNQSTKGLTLYGDDQNLVVWGVEGNRLLIKQILNGKETILWETSNDGNDIYLRIAVTKGRMLEFAYSTDGNIWTKTDIPPLDTNATVRWDRVARPGLIHIGSPEEPARFEYFSLINTKQ